MHPLVMLYEGFSPARYGTQCSDGSAFANCEICCYQPAGSRKSKARASGDLRWLAEIFILFSANRTMRKIDKRVFDVSDEEKIRAVGQNLLSRG